MRKLSFTGEPMDSETAALSKAFGGVPASMYGTTEVGVVLANYPGAEDLRQAGALGKPVPGGRVEVQATGRQLPRRVSRRDDDLPPRQMDPDQGSRLVDEDGYFYHAGRADDVIISAGWTMSAVEIEDAMLKHPTCAKPPHRRAGRSARAGGQGVRRVASRRGRGLRRGDAGFQVRSRLSRHEYPRQIAFVDELPKTPAGKVNRKVLREREAAPAPNPQP
jgi:acetyl-CoA synthetase